MKFSQRLGFSPVKDLVQIESMDDDLINSLWSVFLENMVEKTPLFDLGSFMKRLWFNFFKYPLDTLSLWDDGSASPDYVKKVLRKYFYDPKTEWYERYDFIEFCAKTSSKNFIDIINAVLEREQSAYRFVNKQLVQITSSLEIKEIEEAILKSNKYSSVNTHLNTAIHLLSDRKKPDYRNSIKESISAIESICKIFTQNEKATLGEALNKLEKSYDLHPALKKSFSSLYGYTSDDAGIRHALTENNRIIDYHEAKFILVTCSAFANFLISKM